jgi:hypothetical protein
MTLPRLELTEDPNKNNYFIIFRYSSKGKKTKQSKSVTKKHETKKRRTRKSRKGLFNIF